MAKVSGMKVKLYIKNVATGVVLGGQKSATLNRSAESMDATAKDSEGNWKEAVAGFKEWSIDADGCFVQDDAAYELLEAAFMDSTEVECYLEFPSGTKYSGKAIVTDFPIEAPFDDLVTYSLSLQGNGALAKTEGV